MWRFFLGACPLFQSYTYHQWDAPGAPTLMTRVSSSVSVVDISEHSSGKTPLTLKVPINIQDIKARKSDLLGWRQATPYGKQKSALAKELTGFLGEPCPASRYPISNSGRSCGLPYMEG